MRRPMLDSNRPVVKASFAAPCTTSFVRVESRIPTGLEVPIQAREVAPRLADRHVLVSCLTRGLENHAENAGRTLGSNA